MGWGKVFLSGKKKKKEMQLFSLPSETLGRGGEENSIIKADEIYKAKTGKAVLFWLFTD